MGVRELKCEAKKLWGCKELSVSDPGDDRIVSSGGCSSSSLEVPETTSFKLSSPPPPPPPPPPAGTFWASKREVVVGGGNGNKEAEPPGASECALKTTLFSWFSSASEPDCCFLDQSVGMMITATAAEFFGSSWTWDCCLPISCAQLGSICLSVSEDSDGCFTETSERIWIIPSPTFPAAAASSSSSWSKTTSIAALGLANFRSWEPNWSSIISSSCCCCCCCSFSSSAWCFSFSFVPIPLPPPPPLSPCAPPFFLKKLLWWIYLHPSEKDFTNKSAVPIFVCVSLIIIQVCRTTCERRFLFLPATPETSSWSNLSPTSSSSSS